MEPRRGDISTRGSIWVRGRPYLSPVTHNGAEDAGRGDGGLIERVPEGLPAAPVDREVLHGDRVLRGDRLHGQETGGEAD